MTETPNFIHDQSIFSLILASGPVVKLVVLILVILSVASWTITIAKYLHFRKVRQDSEKFSRVFWETRNLARIDDATRRLEVSPLAQVFISGYRELAHLIQEVKSARSGVAEHDMGTIERVLKRTEFAESLKLERGITFLATVASSAPFIGLFGTVWGIMNAFRGLSTTTSTTLQAVAPGISEALVTTAIGLAAAIPAAIAYNYFVVTVREFKESMDKFSSEFLNLAKRYYAVGG